MARSAIIGDARVIKDRRVEGDIVVTEVTILACGQVTCGFYHRRRCGKERTGMATFATRCKIGVNVTQKD